MPGCRGDNMRQHGFFGALEQGLVSQLQTQMVTLDGEHFCGLDICVHKKILWRNFFGGQCVVHVLPSNLQGPVHHCFPLCYSKDSQLECAVQVLASNLQGHVHHCLPNHCPKESKSECAVQVLPPNLQGYVHQCLPRRCPRVSKPECASFKPARAWVPMSPTVLPPR